MATTPQQAASNGHGNSSAVRLDKLLEFHERAAAALRLTIGLLNGQATAAKTNGHATTLAQAIALDGARAEKTKPKRPRSKLAAQRAQTAAVLAAFHESKPRSGAEVATELSVRPRSIGFGPLLRYGYLKRKRGGFVRTAKAYEVRPTK